MSKSIGTLGYRSDHYWVVDRTGQDDYELQARDSMEIWMETHRLLTRIASSSDSWRRLWRFLDKGGTMVVPRLGVKVQL